MLKYSEYLREEYKQKRKSGVKISSLSIMLIILIFIIIMLFLILKEDPKIEPVEVSFEVEGISKESGSTEYLEGDIGFPEADRVIAIFTTNHEIKKDTADFDGKNVDVSKNQNTEQVNNDVNIDQNNNKNEGYEEEEKKEETEEKKEEIEDKEINSTVEEEKTDIEKLKEIVGKNSEELLEKGIISKSQIPYQITGNLKEKIENTISRKIDYSKDRFYLVKLENVNLEIDLNRKYIYDLASGDIIDITSAKTKRNIATWLMDESKDNVLENKEIQDEFFEKLEEYDITQIYVSEKPSKIIDNKQFKEFVSNAYNRNIKIYLTISDENFSDVKDMENTTYNAYSYIGKYNKEVSYRERIAGICYDTEKWISSSDSFKEDNSTRKNYIEYVKYAKKCADKQNLEAIFTLPYWFVQYSYIDENDNVTNMYDKVSKILDEVNLKVYMDSVYKINELIRFNQVNAEKSILEYSTLNECTLNLAVETSFSEEMDTTFYDEELKVPGTVSLALKQLENMYKNTYNAFIFSINHAQNLIDFLGGFSKK